MQRLGHMFAMIAARVRVARPRVEGILGGDDEMFPVAADEFADKFFAGAVGVTVGGVNEIAARRGEGVEHGPGFVPVGAPTPVLAEGHRAQTQFGNAQAGFAEKFVVHKNRWATSPPFLRNFQFFHINSGRLRLTAHSLAPPEQGEGQGERIGA